jgi:hypothetical protein
MHNHMHTHMRRPVAKSYEEEDTCMSYEEEDTYTLTCEGR